MQDQCLLNIHQNWLGIKDVDPYEKLSKSRLTRRLFSLLITTFTYADLETAKARIYKIM